MRSMVFGGALAAALAFGAAAEAKTPCGGSWSSWLDGLAAEARSEGISERSIKAILGEARQNKKVLSRDRSQKAFKVTFLDFSSKRVSSGRISGAKKMRKRYASTFARAERDFGVPAEVILAFWAMETDFGAYRGNFSVVSSLATLAHDCRRPHLFRPQMIAAMKLHEKGDFSAKETGAWAGEMGHLQVLPTTILELGVDGDGDGHVRVKDSAPDAILTGAALLAHHGWRRGEPWIVEVTAPDDFDWSLSGIDSPRSVSDWLSRGLKIRSGQKVSGGLQASLVLPQSRKGPKFLVFRNFREAFLEWNKSLVNTLTAGYLATRIGGAKKYLRGKPDGGLGIGEMKSLQKRLAALGHDVGKIDGILGAKTRAAVRKEQERLGMPADGWPTAAFARAL